MFIEVHLIPLHACILKRQYPQRSKYPSSYYILRGQDLYSKPTTGRLQFADTIGAYQVHGILPWPLLQEDGFTV